MGPARGAFPRLGPGKSIRGDEALFFLGGVSSDFVYPKDEAVAAGMRLRLRLNLTLCYERTRKYSHPPPTKYVPSQKLGFLTGPWAVRRPQGSEVTPALHPPSR